MSGMITAVVGSAVLGAWSADNARIQAKKQHNDTMEAQEAAADEAKLYDLQAGKDTKYSESATTDYGVKKKKKMKTANDLLVKSDGDSDSGRTWAGGM